MAINLLPLGRSITQNVVGNASLCTSPIHITHVKVIPFYFVFSHFFIFARWLVMLWMNAIVSSIFIFIYFYLLFSCGFFPREPFHALTFWVLTPFSFRIKQEIIFEGEVKKRRQEQLPWEFVDPRKWTPPTVESNHCIRPREVWRNTRRLENARRRLHSFAPHLLKNCVWEIKKWNW